MAAKKPVKKSSKAAKTAPKKVRRDVTLRIDLTPENQKAAIECIQKNGDLRITMEQAKLVKIPRSRRIIARDCAWYID